MKVLFTSSQETCLENIYELINFKNQHNKSEIQNTFINQKNIFTYCKYKIDDINRLKLNVINFNLPRGLNKFSSTRPNLILRKYFLFRNKRLINKLVSNHSVFVFSPGGFVEHEIAYQMKKQGKKTILIEGGLQPFDIEKKQLLFEKINNLVIFIFSNIFGIDYFRFGPFKTKFQELDYVVTTGKSSSLIWIENGLPFEKIYEVGVPRYKKLFHDVNLNLDNKVLIYGTGAYKFHSDNYGETKDKEILFKLYNVIKENYPDLAFYILVHPRDDNANIFNQFPSKILINNKDDILKNSDFFFISRRSSLVYEYILSGRHSYFFRPESSRVNFPNNNLILNNIDEFKNKVNLFLSDKLVLDKSVVHETISSETLQSSNLINKLIYND